MEAKTGRPTVAVPAMKPAKIMKGSKGYLINISQKKFNLYFMSNFT
tara:strand:+ start:1005 stop:1142 length:138 start_codon:yes stop_codon:yes gene_type:complete